jgi:hypothetical protein
LKANSTHLNQTNLVVRPIEEIPLVWVVYSIISRTFHRSHLTLAILAMLELGQCEPLATKYRPERNQRIGRKELGLRI